MKDHYTFGDNERAAKRLALLARTFEPSSARFLSSVGACSAARALDLGCGPGHTTELVHRVTGARETWGLDVSEGHVARARARLSTPLAFLVHDLTRAPYPVPEVDVAYLRYVLGHLAAPDALLTACAGSLRVGALFAIEENCALESPDPFFVSYYARVAALQAHYGQDAYVGRRLPRLAEDAGWSVVSYEQTAIELDGRAMASLHAMNVRTWGADPFAATIYDASTITAMVDGMDAVAAGQRSAPPVTCVMGQIVLRRERRPSDEA